MKDRVSELLRQHDLRHTDVRHRILALFFKAKVALSHADIEKKMQLYVDRVTLYRTLKNFVDKGLIHKVLDDSGSVRYALCDTSCSPTHHHDEHVHFKCTQCGMTNCLSQTQVPFIQLPLGYVLADVNVLVQGTCDKCSL